MTQPADLKIIERDSALLPSVTGFSHCIDTGRGVPSALVMRLRRPPFFIAHLGRAGART